MGGLKKGENRNCLVCKNLFYAIRAEIKKGGAKYCSKKCYQQGRIKKIKKICLICKKDFFTKPSLIKINKGIVCSKECSREKISIDRKGKHPSWLNRKGQIPWNKGKKLHYQVWSKGKKLHYDIWCKGKKLHYKVWNKGKKFLAGNKNPNWRGGIGKLPYPFEFTEKLKAEIRKRDNHICQNCKMTEEEHLIVYGRTLAIHHIDYDKKNCSNGNLIAVCISCNFRFNFNRNYWMEFLKNKLCYI